MNKFDQPDTYKMTRLLLPIGVGFCIFLFLLGISIVPFALEEAQTTEEIKSAVILFCIFLLLVCFFVVVRMIKRL